jgi:hypothetical protein
MEEREGKRGADGMRSARGMYGGMYGGIHGEVTGAMYSLH